MEIVEPLLVRQWLLAGIWPESLTWSINWSNKTPLDAVKLGELAKAITALKAAGLLTEETLLRLFSRFVPDFDADMEIEALEKERPDEIQRMAQMAQLDGQQADDDTSDNNDLGDEGDGADSQPG
jgi:hypothetical protein